MRSETPSALRRAVRGLRMRLLHRRKLAAVAAARELHANGYPTYEELAPVNPRRLLYFDTRAQEADVISEAALDARLRSLPARPPRLVFSGRYLPLKGALDVVAAGIELDRRGVDFRLDFYGTGALEPRMRALAEGSAARGKLTIHGAIPYKPDLVQVTRDADLFMSCHVQGDPSCTYVETLACGVPIVGYANEMWSVLCRESGAGRAVPLGDHRALAAAAAALLADPAALREASERARRFALAHSMERAWDARAARLVAIADGAARATAA
jgi:glycosyltransferase involved in cell wall biosynthesis